MRGEFFEFGAGANSKNSALKCSFHTTENPINKGIQANRGTIKNKPLKILVSKSNQKKSGTSSERDELGRGQPVRSVKVKRDEKKPLHRSEAIKKHNYH